VKTLNDFLKSKEIILPEPVEESVEPEVLMVTEEPHLAIGGKDLALQHQHSPMDPPNVLIMRRKSVRQFPNGQRVALYYVDKIDKYVTVPYTAMQWSASTPEEVEYSGEIIGEGVISQLKEIVEKDVYGRVQFEDGKKMLVTVDLAEKILKVHNVLNESNKYQLSEMANKDKEHFGKVIDFAVKYLK
jgi:hypothetical protein